MSAMSNAPIAVIGGTGKLGKALSGRLARVGFSVVIGSRNLEKANAVAEEINAAVGRALVSAADHNNAIKDAAIVFIAVPFSAHFETINELSTELTQKLVIDVAVPLNPGSRSVYSAPKFGSAALEARQILGEQTQIVDAFQHIGAEHFYDTSNPSLDVLVCGSPQTARHQVIELVNQLGFHGVDAGPIENSVIVEGITPLLIHMNKIYKKTGLGIKIQGL